MGIRTMIQRLLQRAGMLAPYNDKTVQAAETENLIHDRERIIASLDAANKTFYERSTATEEKVSHGREEVNGVVDGLKRASVHAADARSILENIIAKRALKERRLNRKLYGHD